MRDSVGSGMIVADTNLIAYFLIEMEETQVAQACANRDPIWIAPAIWRHEFINVLTQYVRTRGLPVDQALRALAAADRIIETITVRAFDERVIRWAADHKFATYDSEFVIAAEVSEVRLVTADKALLREFPSRAISPADFALGK